ncbi:unnamed protein product [Auanema sp. JU1783]|nr:unnamed protein product [Auanema sp. JU1783]
MDKVDIEQTYKPRRFHWYIRPKGSSASEKDCSCTASTSRDDCHQTDSLRDDLSEYRFCRGGISAKSLSNMIIIALIQEITCGLIFATRDELWYSNLQMLFLAACRIIQLAPCFCALLGNYRNNAVLVFPFMIIQTTVGSYADIQSYLVLLQDWRDVSSDLFLLSSPFYYLVIPLFGYVLALLLVLYIQYKSMKIVNKKKNSLARYSTDVELMNESLM